jgi:guanosine-3',5'-bis(diphosphate) 3'-pyrophosphohydrolase
LLITAGIADTATLQAALLHDTIEDTNTTLQELEHEFGAHVAAIVQECTDDKHLAKAERKRLQVETAPHKSTEAKCVKLADKLYNLRDLLRAKPVGWSDKRRHDYFIWAKQVTDGCRGTNTYLEKELDALYEKVLK